LEPILLKPPIELPAADEPIALPAADEPVQLPAAEEAAPVVKLEPAPTPLSRPAETAAMSQPASYDVIDETQSAQSETVELREAQPQPVVVGPPRSLLGRVAGGISHVSSRVFGALTLIVSLSFLAAYPVVQIFSLGYLLEAAGRIGRSGRLRDAFPLVPQAARIGGALLGSWLVILPLRLAGVLAIDSGLLESASPMTRFFETLTPVLTVLVPLHILFALLRGGRLRYFFWPFNVVWFVRRVWRGGYFQEAWRNSVAFFRELNPFHYFYLGFHGGLGALIWLAIPTTFYAVGSSKASAPAAVSTVENSAEEAATTSAEDDGGIIALRVLVGAVLLSVVVLYVPFLQVHYAVENRFRALFEVGKVRERFRRAPFAFLFALVFTLLLVLPLYLLKVQVVPRDALWLPSLFFIVTIFPLKVMTGWAYGRAGRKQKNAHWIFRVGCRLLMIPVALFYALIVFVTQYTGWHGVQALYEHHAFLLPVAF
jgi:hypothetical protein